MHPVSSRCSGPAVRTQRRPYSSKFSAMPGSPKAETRSSRDASAAAPDPSSSGPERAARCSRALNSKWATTKQLEMLACWLTVSGLATRASTRVPPVISTARQSALFIFNLKVCFSFNQKILNFFRGFQESFSPRRRNRASRKKFHKRTKRRNKGPTGRNQRSRKRNNSGLKKLATRMACKLMDTQFARYAWLIRLDAW